MTERENSTKRRLHRIARRLIRKHGFDAVTIQEICEEAQISKHTFYYYFKSKEDLISDLYDIPQMLSPEQMMSIMGMESPFEQYWKLLEPKINHFIETGPFIMKKMLLANLSHEYEHRPDKDFKFKEQFHPFYDLEKQLIQKAQEKGEVTADYPAEDLMHTNFMSMLGLCQVWTVTNGEIDLKKSIRKQTEIIMKYKSSNE